MAFYNNIEEETLNNKHYRRVIYTDTHLQITLMSLEIDEDIPEEIHDGTQFIRVESGTGEAIVAGEKLVLHDGISITIPSRTIHYIRNTSLKPLKFYSIYSPPEHPEDLTQYVQP